MCVCVCVCVCVRVRGGGGERRGEGSKILIYRDQDSVNKTDLTSLIDWFKSPVTKYFSIFLIILFDNPLK